MTTEKRGTVAYLGPPSTYTHLACLKRFGSSFRAFPVESIQDVFEAVERKEVDHGVVPVENSTEGSVNRTLDLFLESELKVCGEIMSRVSHSLLSQSRNREVIHKIYSHPQALEQCRKWLRKNFPSIDVVETSSTAKAAQMASEDPGSAAIASSFTAQFYRLEVVEWRIEDYLHNCTRFWILGHQIAGRTGNDKTSILFSIPHIAGSLHEVLKLFSHKSINLTKIESRPAKEKPWEYIFFLDFEGHVTDAPIREILDQMKENLLFMKILGSYPRIS